MVPLLSQLMSGSYRRRLTGVKVVDSEEGVFRGLCCKPAKSASWVSAVGLRIGVLGKY